MVPQKNSNTLVQIVIGVVVAVLGLGGVLIYLHNSGNSGATAAVVVAAIDIPQGHQMTPADLTTVSVPTSTIPKGAYPDATQVGGLFSTIAIPANSVLVPNELVSSSPSAAGDGAAGTPLTSAPIPLPDNHVAISIPDNPAAGSGGYIAPGYHVDVIVGLTNGGQVHYNYVVQDAVVLRVGTLGHAGAVDSLLLDVPRQDALVLSSLQDPENSLNPYVAFVVRPLNQYGKNGAPNQIASPPDQLVPGARVVPPNPG